MALGTRRNFLLAATAAFASCGRRRGTGFEGYAFVAAEEGQAIAAVDLIAFAVARHIRVEGRPTAVVADPGRPAVYALTPETGAVHEISTATLALRRTIHVARSAVSMRLAGDGSALWVLCRQPRQLVRLPLDSTRPDVRLALAADPTDFDLFTVSDGAAPKWAAVTCADAGMVALVDLARGSSHTIALGKKLSLTRFRSDGRHVLIGNLDERVLSIHDVPAGRVIVRLPLAVRPENFCVKSDGGQLFITGKGMDAVVIVYPYSTEVAETVLAGRAPGAMAEVISEDSDYLLVANPASGEVTILDIETRRAIATVGVGRGPGYITTTPDRQYALVLNQESGDLAVIRIRALGAQRTKSAPLFTMIPVGSKPVSAAVRGV